jgi:methionyl-tRNA formyltransferase
MRIVIITQNEPFYLYDNLKYLIDIFPKHSTIVGCVVNEVSPFGKKESFFTKVRKTLRIFGFKFFLYYSVKFIKSKIDNSKNIFNLLKTNGIGIIKLSSSINSKESVELIKSYKPDLLISILGNQIFKEQIFNLAPNGCINLHTAKLPKYRGLMPSFWVLKNNEIETAVSVFFVDKGIDSGPIIVQENIIIGDMTQEELIIYSKKIGMEAIVKSVDLIHQNKVVLIENDSSKKTYYGFPTKSDVLDFKKNNKSFF